MTQQSAPLYRQIQQALRGQIESGRYAVGEKLPTELELQREFGVSRATIRSALRDLVDEGLLKATRGVGTVVLRNEPEPDGSALRGVTEDLQRQGLDIRATVLEALIAEPSPSIRAQLELRPSEQTLKVVRLRRMAGTPLALVTSYVPESVGLSPDDDFSGSLYQLIERSLGRRIVCGRDVIRARGAWEEEARLLEVPHGAPLLMIRRISHAEPRRPVECVEALVRSDIYQYSVTVRGGQELP